jgi:hypothetical protein
MSVPITHRVTDSPDFPHVYTEMSLTITAMRYQISLKWHESIIGASCNTVTAAEIHRKFTLIFPRHAGRPVNQTGLLTTFFDKRRSVFVQKQLDVKFPLCLNTSRKDRNVRNKGRNIKKTRNKCKWCREARRGGGGSQHFVIIMVAAVRLII